MNVLYRMLLSFNATAMMLIVYCVKEERTCVWQHPYVFNFLLFAALLTTTWLSLLLSRSLGKESIETFREWSLADNEFLSVYLGYFFVALSISNYYTLIVIYAFVFGFTCLSQTQYFNPLLLIFGYHYYHAVTEQGTHVFIIKYGKIIRNPKDINIYNLRRINDTTYIEMKEEEKQ